MKFQKKEFIPLLFAGDINSYSMARAFYEEYKIKSIVCGKYYTGPSCNSKIVDYIVNLEIDKEDTFLEIVNSTAKQYPDKKIVLIGCADNYVALASKLKNQFESNVVVLCVEYSLMRKLTLKESFYKLCREYSLDIPDTFVYSEEMGEEVAHGFDYPVIVKPSDSVMYFEKKFEGQRKVYKVKSEKELLSVIDLIYSSGYSGKLILQDFIPGDDTYMYVLTGYSDRRGRVKLMALGHVLREEHTPLGLGNHSVIINDVNEEICRLAQNFLESIGYVGFFNFDIKYDSRDKKYKFFEINTRQGRSNYYVTGAGYNLAKYIVDDCIYKKDIKYILATNKKLWTVIPLVLAYMYIKEKKYREEILSFIKSGNVVNPVFFIKDMKFLRFLRFLKTHLSHFRKMKLEL